MYFRPAKMPVLFELPLMLAFECVLFAHFIAATSGVQHNYDPSHTRNVQLADLCNTTCSENFHCDWWKQDNRVEYEFPDGTMQTCVGAQIRCGCTWSMELISSCTYEHPAVVVFLFLFSATVCIVFMIRHVISRSRNEADDNYGSNSNNIFQNEIGINPKVSYSWDDVCHKNPQLVDVSICSNTNILHEKKSFA